jgi:hypothetical protein
MVARYESPLVSSRDYQSAPDIRQRAKIRTDKKRNTKQTVVFRINAIHLAKEQITFPA